MNSGRKASGNWIIYGMIAGILGGVFFGWYFGEAMNSVAFLGNMFINALKASIVPLIMAAMICGVASLGDVRMLGRMGGVTVAYYAGTTFIAILIGLAVTNWMDPGRGMDIGDSRVPDVIEGQEFTITGLILKLIPENVFMAMAELDVLPLIVCSLIFGAALTTIGERAKPLIAFFDSLDAVMMKIIHWIMLFAPIGIFGLIAGLLGSKGGGEAALNELLKLGKFIVTVVIGLGIHGAIVIPLLLWLLTGRSPLEYARNMSSALATAFSTDSSAATLPVTMECVEEKNGVSSQSAAFVLPMGATINMDGTAMYEACAAIFIAQAYGVELTMVQQVIIFLTAALASIGAAAIPHAGLVTLVMVLTAVGLPLEPIGLIYTVDWFLDRCRTTVNVWGDACGAAVVDRFVKPEGAEAAS